MRPRPVRVLIADDEAHIRQLVARIIASLGGEVVAEARDGEEAVRLFELTSPDMGILDINMPSMTGDRALARIVALDPHDGFRDIRHDGFKKALRGVTTLEEVIEATRADAA